MEQTPYIDARPVPPRGLGPLALILALWAGTVTTLAVSGAFDVPPDSPALPTLIAIVVPVLAFGAAVWFSHRIRAWVLALDPVLMTELQAWRILGGTFLVVMALGHLPGFFAWPAGLGDVAIGVAAPFMAWQLRRNPGFLSSSRYRWFLIAGLADFAIAVITGVMARTPIDGLVGDVTSAAMGQVPLVLIPTLAVPAFIILHLVVVLQILARRAG